MTASDIEDLAKRLLVAMYANPSIREEDVKHNAIVAVKAAEALSVTLESRPTED